ncbi:MAG: 50S ribosomal protein L20 [Phycisphaerales bacterium]
MPRVRKGAARTQQKARLRKMTKGYSRSRTAQRGEMKQAIRSSGWYAYRDRRAKKRDYRALWITRITAACKMRGTRYSVFMNGLKNAGIALNRKMLSEIAIMDPATFDTIVKTALAAAKTSAKKAA